MFGKTEELIIVLLIVLLLFGSKKIPELAKGISGAVKEIRKGFSGNPHDDEKEKDSKAGKNSQEG